MESDMHAWPSLARRRYRGLRPPFTRTMPFAGRSRVTDLTGDPAIRARMAAASVDHGIVDHGWSRDGR